MHLDKLPNDIVPDPVSVPTAMALKKPRSPLVDNDSEGWTSVKRARAAAKLMQNTSDQEAFLAFWHGIDEPTRETMLTWFAEWDKEQRRWEP